MSNELTTMSFLHSIKILGIIVSYGFSIDTIKCNGITITTAFYAFPESYFLHRPSIFFNFVPRSARSEDTCTVAWLILDD